MYAKRKFEELARFQDSRTWLIEKREASVESLVKDLKCVSDNMVMMLNSMALAAHPFLTIVLNGVARRKKRFNRCRYVPVGFSAASCSREQLKRCLSA